MPAGGTERARSAWHLVRKRTDGYTGTHRIRMRERNTVADRRTRTNRDTGSDTGEHAHARIRLEPATGSQGPPVVDNRTGTDQSR